MNITWDADKYSSEFSFVPRYGNGVAEWLDVPPGSSVLDLGCGNGVLTKALQEKGYQVQGLDASPELLAIARKNCPEIPFQLGDAACFTLAEPVDAVFSNAVLHWIDGDRQPDLLRCVLRALKPGGQFVLECGGHGNNQKIHGALEKVFQAHGYPYRMPFYFPTIGEYAALLEQAGFLVQRAILFPRPTPLQGEHGLADWIQMFVKTPFSVVPAVQEREEMVQEAVEELRGDLLVEGVWQADYVRLRMKAVRLQSA